MFHGLIAAFAAALSRLLPPIVSEAFLAPFYQEIGGRRQR